MVVSSLVLRPSLRASTGRLVKAGFWELDNIRRKFAGTALRPSRIVAPLLAGYVMRVNCLFMDYVLAVFAVCFYICRSGVDGSPASA